MSLSEWSNPHRRVSVRAGLLQPNRLGGLGGLHRSKDFEIVSMKRKLYLDFKNRFSYMDVLDDWMLECWNAGMLECWDDWMID